MTKQPTPDDAAQGVITRDGLGQFAARIGNELNNPLAAVLAAHQYVRRRIEESGAMRGESRVHGFLDVIESELRATSRIVEDLIEFGKPRPLIRSSFLLGDLVSQCVAGVRVGPGVAIENLVADSLAPVHLDRDRCSRILSHVLQNAADACEGRPSGRVRVEAVIRGGEVEIVVRDDGEGIAEDVLPKIRDPLFSTKTKGTGLGLAIADASARAQGGEIVCESVPGNGTVVTIRLPNG